MTAATSSLDLELLEQILEIQLHSELLPTIPLQVSCLLRDDLLTLLIQHPAPQLPHPKQVFRFLKKFLEQENLILGEQKVLLYLREMAQHQPYAFDSVTIYGKDKQAASLLNFDLGEFSLEADEVINNPMIELDPDLLEAVGIGLDLDPPNSPDTETHFWEQDLPRWEQPITSGFEVEDEPTSARPDPTVGEKRQAETTPPFAETKSVQPTQPNAWFPLLVVGASTSLIMFCGSFYALTRPCVIGTCKAIGEARELAYGSTAILSQPLSGQGILAAQAQLQKSIEVLGSIPPWSPHRNQAQDLQATYEKRAVGLEAIVEALKTAARAGYASQNPPLTIAQWQASQQLWREAITRLEAIPTESDFHTFAQKKLPQYEQNLTSINFRIDQEQEAQSNLASAQEAVQTAEQQEETAISLSNWELASVTWQTVTDHLQEIPEGTTAYEQAQELLTRYSAKMAMVRDRVNQEKYASDIYNQGLRSAQLAQRSQDLNQWSEAVIYWRDALAYIEQVPQNTYHAAKANTLLTSYEEALALARNQLKAAQVFQQVEQDLAQTCAGVPAVCEYTIGDNAITVRLSPTYMQEVTITAVNAEAKRDVATKADLYNHILSLEQAFRAISRNANLPLKVYTPDGALVDTYS
jgi:predicted DNA-binding protein YlxM (UPF0122 family)